MGKPTENHEIPTGGQEKILNKLNVDREFSFLDQDLIPDLVG